MPSSDSEHDRRSPSPASAAADDGAPEAAAAAASPAPAAEPETSEPAATTVTDDKSADTEVDADAAAAKAAEWQAVWSPPHNAYYFFNTRTQETTWINPLVPPSEDTAAAALAASTALVPASSSAELAPVASTSAQPGPSHDPYAAAIAAGIDPALAHLDPTLAYGATAPAGPMSFAAKFNARTGAFTKTDARTPDHLGEFERARRMSEMYFDVNKWEQEVAERKEQELQDELAGKKRKRPSKKDLERFKEQKKRKMIAKTAWLRT